MVALTYKWTRFFSPILALLLVLAPASRAVAQDFDDGSAAAAATETKSLASTAADARADAQRDAEADVSAGGWFAAGFLCGVFGWLYAYLSDSKPPVSRIMGKDSDYVLAYSAEYENKAKGIKTSKTLIGCVVGSVISLVVQLALASAASSSSN